jgi:uncharacterized membrane protein
MKDRYPIILILAFGLVLRLVSLNQSLWLDEATSVLTAKNYSFNQIITNFTPGDFHPPFYYLLLKIWITAVGDSEVKARLLSVVFGLSAVIATYLIAKLISNNKTALLASILVTTSPLQVYYSQEARMYMLSEFLASMAVFIFLLNLKRNNLYLWIWFSCSLIILFSTDYLSAFIIPAIWLYALSQVRDKKWWKNFILAHIPLFLFLGLYSGIFVQQIHTGLAVKSDMPGWWKILGQNSLKDISLIWVKFIIGRISFSNKLIYFSIVSSISLVYTYILFRALKRKVSFCWIWFIFPIIIAIFISVKIPVLYYFRLIFTMPAFLILVANGISDIKNKIIKNLIIFIIISSGLIFTGIYLLNSNYHREDWREMAKFIDLFSKNTSSIIIFPANSQMEALSYYSPTTKFSGPEGLDEKYSQIWLMRYVQDVFDPKDLVRKKIEDLGYKMHEGYNFNGVIVWRYLK